MSVSRVAMTGRATIETEIAVTEVTEVTEAAEAGEVVERDEPPRGGASPWPKQDQPGRIETIKSLRELSTSILSRVTSPPDDPRRPGASSSAAADRLGELLAAIGEDVARDTSAASQAIMQEFAGKISQARRLPRAQRRAAIAAFKQERSAALAAVKLKAATDLASRRKAITDSHSRPESGGADIAPDPK